MGNLQHTEGHARFSANNSIQVLLFFRSKEKPNTVEKWKNNFRVIYNTLTLRVALATFSAVQYLENKNQIQYGRKMEKWKNNFRVIYNTLTLRVALATFFA